LIYSFLAAASPLPIRLNNSSFSAFFRSGSLEVLTPQISTLLCIIDLPSLSFSDSFFAKAAFLTRMCDLTGIIHEKFSLMVLQKMSFLVH
jgi:hypothetical protein